MLPEEINVGGIVSFLDLTLRKYIEDKQSKAAAAESYQCKLS